MVALLFAFQKLVGKNISVALVELLRNHERLRLKRSTIRVMILPHKESAFVNEAFVNILIACHNTVIADQQ